jgi:hypothetical protein
LHAATPPEPFGNPLVYPVGGVNADGSPIAIAREGGTPPIVAISSRATVSDPTLPRLPPRTGTSVAAAVLASAFALVWAEDPELTAAEVMQIVYESGIDRGRKADFWMRGNAPNVHQVSLCRAFQLALGVSSWEDCPQVESPAAPGPTDVAEQVELAIAYDETRGAFFSAISVDLSPAETYCCLETWPWVNEFPAIAPCGDCVGLSDPTDTRIFIAIDTAYKGTLTEATVVLRDSSGNMRRFSFPYAADIQLERGTTFVLTGIPAGQVHSAWIEFVSLGARGASPRRKAVVSEIPIFQR